MRARFAGIARGSQPAVVKMASYGGGVRLGLSSTTHLAWAMSRLRTIVASTSRAGNDCRRCAVSGSLFFRTVRKVATLACFRSRSTLLRSGRLTSCASLWGIRYRVALEKDGSLTALLVPPTVRLLSTASLSCAAQAVSGLQATPGLPASSRKDTTRHHRSMILQRSSPSSVTEMGSTMAQPG